MSWSRPRGRRRPRRCRTPSSSEGIAGRPVGQLGGHARRCAGPRRARRTPRARRRRARPGSACASACAPGSKRSIAARCRSTRGFARTSQRVARSTSRRPSISIASCASAIDLVVERLDLLPERAHRRTPRARPRTRARVSTAARRSPRRRRNANVVPARSTSWLATTVAMISRRSRCARISLAEALGQRRREVALEVVGQVRVLGQV